MLETHAPLLVGVLLALAGVSVAVSPRVRTVDGFFRGWSEQGRAPGVFTLTLSQVTTWIFARSLLNAGILGYYYGSPGPSPTPSTIRLVRDRLADRRPLALRAWRRQRPGLRPGPLRPDRDRLLY